MINQLLQNLQRKSHRDFSEFLAQIDIIQSNSLPELVETGIPEQYAKALLLKISNLLIGKFQYKNRHDYLISHPYALIVDPANSCPLHCPGCLHNKAFQEKIGTDWPPGLLTKEHYDKFIDQFGPYATTALFYNWGEPLLNKNTPLFIQQAKSYLLDTSLSSNLSVHFDAEALVLSGLDYMILSIDGATKESYECYRQGGRFDLAIENVQRLVAAKRKFNMATPWLSWQFLLFAHNKHEIELARKMATELGVNEIHFTRPYDVLWDQKLTPAHDMQGELCKLPKDQNCANRFDIMGNISALFNDRFAESWEEKHQGINTEAFTPRTGKTCQWLYTTLVMDAANRYLPCCYAPRKESGFTYVFGDSQNTRRSNPFNSEYYRFSRKHFSWLSGLHSGGVAPKLAKGKSATYCVACQDRHLKPLVNDIHLQRYLEINYSKLLTPETVRHLSTWTEQ